MNKKLMAVAVAGALAAPAVAFAQASNVQIYGRANVGLDNVSATGATAANSDFKGRNRVWDQGSRLGFRGTEDLGGGLKAVFDIQTGINMDNGTTTGANGSVNASTGTLASRDSYGGIEGGFGSVRFGRQSVWWTNLNDQTQSDYINVGLQFETGGFGRLGSPSARTSNVMKYTSPVWSGFQATISYSPQSENAVANADPNGKLWGATFTYQGPVMLQWDWAKKNVETPAAAGSLQNVITGNKLGIGWNYRPNAIISLSWIQLKNENNTADGLAGELVPLLREPAGDSAIGQARRCEGLQRHRRLQEYVGELLYAGGEIPFFQAHRRLCLVHQNLELVQPDRRLQRRQHGGGTHRGAPCWRGSEDLCGRSAAQLLIVPTRSRFNRTGAFGRPFFYCARQRAFWYYAASLWIARPRANPPVTNLDAVHWSVRRSREPGDRASRLNPL